MLSVSITPDKFENATITGHFGFVFEKTRAGKSRDDHREVIVLKKLRFQNGFVYTERKGGVFKFLRFEERFEKLRFRDGLAWTVGLIVEIKPRFQISPA